MIEASFSKASIIEIFDRVLLKSFLFVCLCLKYIASQASGDWVFETTEAQPSSLKMSVVVPVEGSFEAAQWKAQGDTLTYT